MPSGLQRETTTVHDTYILYIDLQVWEDFFFSCNLIQLVQRSMANENKEVCFHEPHISLTKSAQRAVQHAFFLPLVGSSFNLHVFLKFYGLLKII